MDNLIFSLNATLPVFMLMVIGYLLNKVGVLDDILANKANQFVFKVALPVLVFKDLANSDFYAVWDTRYVFYCFLVTLISILILWGLSSSLKDKSLRAEFIQAGYRSSAALLGCALIQNIYGEARAAALMIIGSVPLYNIMAVVLLTLFKPDAEHHGKLNAALIKKTVKGIVTNPIIIGIVLGMIWSLSGLKQPKIMEKTISNLAGIATPLGLMAMGASFDIKKAYGKLKLSLVCSLFKLIIFVMLFLPVAVMLGFREDKLVSALVMLGAATTVSSFTMARSMGHEGTLTSSTVMITTLLSAFTLTAWLYVIKSLALI